SRRRSVVGRTVAVFGPASARERSFPPTTRIILVSAAMDAGRLCGRGGGKFFFWGCGDSARFFFLARRSAAVCPPQPPPHGACAVAHLPRQAARQDQRQHRR